MQWLIVLLFPLPRLAGVVFAVWRSGWDWSLLRPDHSDVRSQAQRLAGFHSRR